MQPPKGWRPTGCCSRDPNFWSKFWKGTREFLFKSGFLWNDSKAVWTEGPRFSLCSPNEIKLYKTGAVNCSWDFSHWIFLTPYRTHSVVIPIFEMREVLAHPCSHSSTHTHTMFLSTPGIKPCRYDSGCPHHCWNQSWAYAVHPDAHAGYLYAAHPHSYFVLCLPEGVRVSGMILHVTTQQWEVPTDFLLRDCGKNWNWRCSCLSQQLSFDPCSFAEPSDARESL